MKNLFCLRVGKCWQIPLKQMKVEETSMKSEGKPWNISCVLERGGKFHAVYSKVLENHAL
jgi:hypothetical protein